MNSYCKEDYAMQLQNLANDIMEYVSNEFQDCYTFFSDEITEKVISLLDVEKPKIMVYGIYNSGKSTLINSLCRSEVAEIADRPMTDQITEYDRGEYYLVDSPGVDAPIQHEMVTEEHLSKCHIILFVISNKGMFEDRTNYAKLANLIGRDIPFVIVLNDRGFKLDKEWDDEKKKRVKFDHDQELKITQYKIIQNLIKSSNDKNIADKYEVIILNAKKAWDGVKKEKPQLIEASGIDFLEKRIDQLLSSEAGIGMMFKQPVMNLRIVMNDIEKIITQSMSGNNSEDFAMRIHTLERKKENIIEELKILVKQAVNSRLDELSISYSQGDSDVFESVANGIFMDIDGRYSAKLTELLAHVDHNFKELNLHFDNVSNLSFEVSEKEGRVLKFEEETSNQNIAGIKSEPEKKGFFNFMKSRKKREKEKEQRLRREAELRNEQAQYKMQEMIRRKQEARQFASCDLDELYREFNMIVKQGIDEKFNDIISQIQEIDCMNKQVLESGKRQMAALREFRSRLNEIEIKIG